MLVGLPFEKKVPSRYSLYDKVKVKLVQIWTKSKYFHSEFILGDRWISAETDGIIGHKLHPLEDGYDYIFIDIELSDYHSRKIFEFMEIQIGSKYDWVGIYLSQFVPLGANARDKWFCSELTTKLLQLCMLKEALPLQPHMTSPDELFKILMKLVDSGDAYFESGNTANIENIRNIMSLRT